MHRNTIAAKVSITKAIQLLVRCYRFYNCWVSKDGNFQNVVLAGLVMQNWESRHQSFPTVCSFPDDWREVCLIEGN